MTFSILERIVASLVMQQFSSLIRTTDHQGFWPKTVTFRIIINLCQHYSLGLDLNSVYREEIQALVISVCLFKIHCVRPGGL